MSVSASNLPIDSLEPELRRAVREGPVVVSSPTGSGKSTQVPRWLPGPVLVVEPRRVACRSLALRVAELEGSPLGEDVGYWVRDDRRVGESTRITFATPGVALRIFERVDRYGAVVLDEFHERTLEVDLLLALLKKRREEEGGRDPDGSRQGLAVMSATLAGERVAEHLGGIHLHAEGRIHPVAVQHLPCDTLLPDGQGLERRVVTALEEARELSGDVLVFLPGKAEIASCAAALAGRGDLEVIELHGGLSLGRQNRAFEPSSRRKVILATNVAETSITLPGIGVVIDSGLVRRTRYHQGRGFLTLVPVAMDSAEQRAGRAGRTAAGVCFRLWDEAARLESRTPPEIHREALAPLVLAAAACGADPAGLPFLDPPKEHALETAREELQALGALEAPGALTDRGRQLFGLPLDAPLGALLAEAEAREAREVSGGRQPEGRAGDSGILRDLVDLVSVLAPGRRIFLPGGKRRPDEPPVSPEEACDAVAILRGLRGGGTSSSGSGSTGRRLDAGTLAEARSVRERLERAFDLGPRPPATASVDRERLALTVLAADPRRAHVARRRGRGRKQRVAWSHGGTEIELARESGVHRTEGVEAIVVLDTLALGLGGGDTRVLATCAMPVPTSWLVTAGLGRHRLGEVVVEKRAGRPHRVVARMERVYARRVLDVTEEVPQGAAAREAVARLFQEGRIFPEAWKRTRSRLEAAALARDLARQGGRTGQVFREVESLFPDGVPNPERWVRDRLQSLGFESGDDLALLTPQDLTAAELPGPLQAELDRRFPLRIELPDATYRVRYELARKRVTLEKVAGGRTDPPPLAWLPGFQGFAVRVRHGDMLRTLRDRHGRRA